MTRRTLCVGGINTDPPEVSLGGASLKYRRVDGDLEGFVVDLGESHEIRYSIAIRDKKQGLFISFSSSEPFQVVCREVIEMMDQLTTNSDLPDATTHP
jgi:hypothetical protein